MQIWSPLDELSHLNATTKRLLHSPWLWNWSVNGSKSNWSFKQAPNSSSVLKGVLSFKGGGFWGMNSYVNFPRSMIWWPGSAGCIWFMLRVSFKAEFPFGSISTVPYNSASLCKSIFTYFLLIAMKRIPLWSTQQFSSLVFSIRATKIFCYWVR